MPHSMTIVRRRNLGRGSVRSVQRTLSDLDVNCWRSWRDSPPSQADVYLRWGCTSAIPNLREGATILNKAEAIHRVNDKMRFAQILAENSLAPSVITPSDTSGLMSTVMYVVRPPHHSRGRNLTVIPSENLLGRPGEWYARPLIRKESEFRVYVLFGRVAAVAQKIVNDPTQVAWNHAVGAEFVNVRWSDWNLRLCDTALKAAALSGLEYAAVDVMVEDGTLTPWIIEVNSAGSLPPNEDGSPSYRARCVAECLGWHLTREDYSVMLPPVEVSNWRDVIHPAIWRNHPLNGEQLELMFTTVRSTSPTIDTEVQSYQCTNG